MEAAWSLLCPAGWKAIISTKRANFLGNSSDQGGVDYEHFNRK